MSEEPPNPFYMYDNATDEYLNDNLFRLMKQYQSYKKWTEQTEDEIQYIRERLKEKQKSLPSTGGTIKETI